MHHEIPRPGATPLTIFRFRIDDPDPEVLVFGCVATSEAEAELIARLAGHSEFALMDATPLPVAQTQEAAFQRIKTNPFLGPRWLPLAEVMSTITQPLRPGKFWSVSTYTPEHQFDPHRSPFVQAMLEADGALHVEIGGTLTADLRPHREQILTLLGWVDTSTVSDDPDDLRKLPLPYRTFEPGWNSVVVAESVLSALTGGYGVDDRTAFNVGDTMTELIRGIDGLDFVDGGPIFFLEPSSEA